MNKAQREKLAAATRALLASYGDTVSEFQGPLTHSIEVTATGKHGPVAIKAYMPTDPVGMPWLACRFIDWNIETMKHWDHWKQNVHLAHTPSHTEWLDIVESHLNILGLSAHATRSA